MWIRTLILLPLFFAAPCFASTISDAAATQEWRALLHFPRGGARSYVDHPAFFLAETGVVDPEAELLASIGEFTRRPELTCNYPARYAWMRQQGLLPRLFEPDCDEYRQWREKLDVADVVLVLASSYLNSPSSMYGHTFLRLDPAGDRGESDFLSYALNFGANIGPGEQDMFYIYRGLFGGYPGLFSLQPYYQKIQEYNKLENRDIWEYRLNLDAEEIDRLLSHAWELRQVNFDYYFFDENCSFRLLELLEVARPGVDVTSPFDRAAMPVDTVREVVNQGMVSEISYRPARRLELDTLLSALSPDEQVLVKKLAEGSLGIDDFIATSVPSRQQPVLLAAYRYLRYVHNEGERDPAIARRSLQLLRQAKVSGALEFPDVPRPQRPDRGHNTSMLALAAGDRDGDHYVDLNWRISYHDALDLLPGYPEGATLEMGDIALRWQEKEGLKLQRFIPINIRSLSPRDRFFSPLSWQVGTGVERLDDAPTAPLVAQFTAGGGLSWKRFFGVSYVMARARLEYNEDFSEDWRLAPGLALGQLWQGAQVSAEVGAGLYDFGSEGRRKYVSLAASYAVSANHALRLTLDYRDQPWGYVTGGELAWRYHF